MIKAKPVEGTHSMSDTYLYVVYYLATFCFFVSCFRTIFSAEIRYKPLFYFGGFLGLIPSLIAILWCIYEYISRVEMYLLAALIYAWVGIFINSISLILICIYFGFRLLKKFKQSTSVPGTPSAEVVGNLPQP